MIIFDQIKEGIKTNWILKLFHLINLYEQYVKITTSQCSLNESWKCCIWTFYISMTPFECGNWMTKTENWTNHVISVWTSSNLVHSCWASSQHLFVTQPLKFPLELWPTEPSSDNEESIGLTLLKLTMYLDCHCMECSQILVWDMNKFHRNIRKKEKK